MTFSTGIFLCFIFLIYIHSSGAKSGNGISFKPKQNLKEKLGQRDVKIVSSEINESIQSNHGRVGSTNPKIGIVGATGAVGEEILAVMEKKNFPCSSIHLYASERSIGNHLLLLFDLCNQFLLN
jgi:hypothetical protein